MDIYVCVSLSVSLLVLFRVRFVPVSRTSRHCLKGEAGNVIAQMIQTDGLPREVHLHTSIKRLRALRALRAKNRSAELIESAYVVRGRSAHLYHNRRLDHRLASPCLTAILHPSSPFSHTPCSGCSGA